MIPPLNDLAIAISKAALAEDLRFGHGIVRGIAIRENAGQLRHFGKPPAVFALAFDLEIYALAILRRSTLRPSTIISAATAAIRCLRVWPLTSVTAASTSWSKTSHAFAAT